MKEQIRPEDKVRRALEGARAKMLVRFGEKKSRMIVRLSLLALLLTVLLVVTFFLLRIESIEVTGDVTMFNESEIIAAAEIAEGDGLFWRSSARIRRNIEKNLPAIQKVKVTKSLFGKVTINVELVSVEYYFEYGGSFYALDSSLTVLDKNDSYTKYSAYGAVKVILPEIREPKVGERIVFYYTVEETDTEGEPLYEVKEEKSYRYVSEFLTALSDSGYRDDANGVILSEKFDVALIYAEKFKIRFGSVESLDVKFRILYEIFAEGSMQYADKAYIDLSTPSAATARPDPTLDLSEFVD
ncbi:MAG: FtsQ-type POTRA domain-containing protein [Ruminococcaceae bacterium]|nr:FtsQ-type POTRA domain-containing protein [Oscillospiraceae bacterium]